MITRECNLKAVAVLDQLTWDASCATLVGATSTTFAALNGRIIDRQGLGRRYNAAMPVGFASGDIGTSTGLSKYVGLSAKLQHACTTCAADFVDYSTQFQAVEQPLDFLTNTTSTVAGSGGKLSTAQASTSTGYVAGATAPMAYDLTGAFRFLRCVILPRMDGSSSGGPAMVITGAVIFADPDVVLPNQEVTSSGIAVKSTA